MRFGVHSYIFTDRWSDDQLDVLDTIRELGGELAEIAVGDDIAFNYALTRRRAEALSLSLTVGPGGEWPLACDLSSDDPAERELGLAWHKRQVDAAAEMGALAYCGAVYGHPGVVKRRVPPADELPRTAEMLARLAEYAGTAGVLLVIEPMSHFRTHLINTSQQAMRLLELAGHDNLQLLLDTYHMVTEERDFGAAIRSGLPRLWGIHACENDRGAPGGGIVPWDDVLQALGGSSYTGWVVLEAYNSSVGDFAWRRGMFHNVCPDGRAFVRHGFRFLQEQVAAVESRRNLAQG